MKPFFFLPFTHSASNTKLEKGRKKKGFMTPERKKKLRQMILKITRQRIEEETRKRVEERRKFINEKCGEPKELNGLSDDQLKAVCRDYHERIKKLESEKYDLEKQTSVQTNKFNETNTEVNNLRGKFVKPALKKVSNTKQDKFAKLQKTAKDFDFRQKLKVVKKKEFSISEDDSLVRHNSFKTKPEWTGVAKSKSFVSETPPESPTVKENNDDSSSAVFDEEEE
jgi:hypothetical protein